MRLDLQLHRQASNDGLVLVVYGNNEGLFNVTVLEELFSDINTLISSRVISPLSSVSMLEKFFNNLPPRSTLSIDACNSSEHLFDVTKINSLLIQTLPRRFYWKFPAS